MSTVWTEVELQQHITDAIPESLNLDYKASGSLAKTNDKRAEITKDVSAMANSDGGVIIYGISEDRNVTPPVPGQITPVDASVISKEWLEHVINNIRPRLTGFVIHPVQLSSAPNHFAYVVEIPQSTTAHQAMDKRYYKRFNFESAAMEDYEIRDVMARSQHAQIELKFQIRMTYEREFMILPMPTGLFGQDTKPEPKTRLDLEVIMTNTGSVYAQYVRGYLELPSASLYDEVELADYKKITLSLDQYDTYECDNTKRDVTKYEFGRPSEYGPSRYVPLLPKTSFASDSLRLREDFQSIDWQDHTIRWTIHADNASPRSGEVPMQDINVIDDRENIG